MLFVFLLPLMLVNEDYHITQRYFKFPRLVFALCRPWL